jgi:hypothetical protein
MAQLLDSYLIKTHSNYVTREELLRIIAGLAAGK